MEEKLKKLIEQAKNYAFIQLCSIDEDGWDLHPSERHLAETIYTAPATKEFNMRGAHDQYRIEMGRGNVGKEIKYPSPSLDTGPF